MTSSGGLTMTPNEEAGVIGIVLPQRRVSLRAPKGRSNLLACGGSHLGKVLRRPAASPAPLRFGDQSTWLAMTEEEVRGHWGPPGVFEIATAGCGRLAMTPHGRAHASCPEGLRAKGGCCLAAALLLAMTLSNGSTRFHRRSAPCNDIVRRSHNDTKRGCGCHRRNPASMWGVIASPEGAKQSPRLRGLASRESASSACGLSRSASLRGPKCLARNDGGGGSRPLGATRSVRDCHGGLRPPRNDTPRRGTPQPRAGLAFREIASSASGLSRSAPLRGPKCVARNDGGGAARPHWATRGVRDCHGGLRPPRNDTPRKGALPASGGTARRRRGGSMQAHSPKKLDGRIVFRAQKPVITSSNSFSTGAALSGSGPYR